MKNVLTDKEQTTDPSINLDLRLTHTEWVLYWKSKYENLLRKVVAAQRLIEAQDDKLKSLMSEKKVSATKIVEASKPVKKKTKKKTKKR